MNPVSASTSGRQRPVGIAAPLAFAGSAAAAVASVVAVGGALAWPISDTSDFAAFWRAGRWLVEGRVGKLYPLSSFGGVPEPIRDGGFKGFLNPPHTTVLFVPFAHLELRAATLAFAALNVAALVALAVVAWRYFSRVGFALGARATAVALVVACPAVATSIVNGTLSLFVVLAVIAVLHLDRNGDAWVTGFPLAVVAWKPQYALLPAVFLLARRHYRAVGTAAAITALTVLATLPFVGSSPWRAYFPFLNRYAATLDIWDVHDARQLWLPRQMLNARGLLIRTLGVGAVSAINTISALIIVLIVVLVFVLGRRMARQSRASALQPWGAVIALTVVTSQHTNVSDGVLLLLPAILLATGGQVRRPAVALWWIAVLDVAMTFGNPSGKSPIVPWSALVAIVLTAAAWVRALRAESDQPAWSERRSEHLKAPVSPVDGTPMPLATRVPAGPARESRATRPDASGLSTGLPLLESFLLGAFAIAMTVMPYVIVGRGPDAWQRSASLSFADFIALLLAAIGLPQFVARIRGRQVDRLIWAGLAVLGVLALTTAAHLSPRGVVLTLRFAVCLMLADLLARTAARRRDVLVRWIGIAALFQCTVAVAQRVTRHAVGLAFLGEPLYPFRAGYPVPAGTMRDAYPLAAFGLFAAALHGISLAQGWSRSRLSIAVLAAGGVLAGLSGSRAAILTVLLIVGALVVSTGRKGLPVAAVLLGGLALSAIPSHDLWVGRAAMSTGSDAQGGDASNGRSALNGQAVGLIRRNPLIGVGPGNYSEALRNVPELVAKNTANGLLPVHDMPLLAVAESGMLIVIPLAVVAFSLVLQGVRRRGRWSPLLFSIVPYLVLDLVFWFYPEGLYMVATAIGLTIAGSLARPIEPLEEEAASGDLTGVPVVDPLSAAVERLTFDAGIRAESPKLPVPAGERL